MQLVERSAVQGSLTATCLAHLAPEHYAKMKASGLTDETIRRCGAYTEHDITEIRRRLNDPYSLAQAPALALPGNYGCGPTDYIVYRMLPPVRRADGKECKYLQPRGKECRAYFPPLPAMHEVLGRPSGVLVITEGIFKALASTQEGVPCIGLMGMWNWQRKRHNENAPRLLILDLSLGWEWLAEFDCVLIVCDYDPTRKPGVHQAACELAHVLTWWGIRAIVSMLPPGPPRLKNPKNPLTWDGRYEKQGTDDLIARNGGEAWRAWVEEQTRVLEVQSLSEYRVDHRAARLATVGQTGVHLDTAPTGAGKSFGDVAIMKQLDQEGRRSLTLVPTHAAGDEAYATLSSRGLDVGQLPPLDGSTCLRWDEAQAVIKRGLSAPVVLCPDCELRELCQYRQLYKEATEAPHLIATHQRAVVRMHDIAKDRDMVLVHEKLLDLVRPTHATINGLVQVGFVARQAAAIAVEGKRNNGKPSLDREFYLRMEDLCNRIDSQYHSVNKPTEIDLPLAPEYQPENIQRDLNEAIISSGVNPPKEALIIAVGATCGELSGLYVEVEDRPDGKDKTRTIRSLVAVSKTDLPRGRSILLSDATADPAELRWAVDRTIQHITPPAGISLQHPVLQIVPSQDVTRGSDPKRVAAILRGILFDVPEYRRVGLLTHKPLLEERTLLEHLEPEYRERVKMASYFGGALACGSNGWIKGDLDALIILGTPRVGTAAIRQHLLRIGKKLAGLRPQEEIKWTWDYWRGITESGDSRTIRTKQYNDHDWHAAYCNIVRRELRQAVGRARAILSNGIPCLVVTTESLAPIEEGNDGRHGLTIADHPFAPITKGQARVMAILRSEPENCPVLKTGRIAAALGITPHGARPHLEAMVEAKRVGRLGKGSGWFALPSQKVNLPL
jgi:hypothetical protein